MIGGDRLLIDPDTFWQIAVGQWIVDHRTVPVVDTFSLTMRGHPWISTQWLAQVVYSQIYKMWGWTGPVVIASLSIAATFALLARFLMRRFDDVTVMIVLPLSVLVALPHLHARPHVLALPVMVAWVGALLSAAERRAAPRFALIALMTLWANLHGSFIFGLALIAPIALDAVINAKVSDRRELVLRWGLFAVVALAASCVTPYGWNSILAARAILNLGEALKLIIEWLPADFSSLGPLEISALMAIGFALVAGVKLPPVRVLLFLGLLYMALAHNRNTDVFALLSPMVVASPLAAQFSHRARDLNFNFSAPRAIEVAGLAGLMLLATVGITWVRTFQPEASIAPVAAVEILKQHNVQRVFNSYGVGGYLIFEGIPPYIDGRTELYGEAFVLQHADAQGLRRPAEFFRLLDQYDIEATLLRRSSPAGLLLDQVDGWRKIYIDDHVVAHIRDRDAVHSVDPVIKPRAD
jgi:hypothetical protein